MSTFLLGLACGVALTLPWLLLRRRPGLAAPVPRPAARAPAAAAPERTPAPAPAPAEPPAAVEEPASRSPLATIASGIGHELADLASGIEGHATLLCESVGEPEKIAENAEHLWNVVQRLRLFSEKILSSARTSSPLLAPTDVGALLDTLRSGIGNQVGGGLSVQLRVARVLPCAIAEPTTLRHAILFLIDALLKEEPDAGALRIDATNSSNDSDDPTIQIEITVESECLAAGGTPAHPPPPVPDWQLALLAARTLLDGLNAQLDLRHRPGGGTTAIVTLDATSSEAPALAPETEAEFEPAAHPFGGVLVLESDRAVRELLARALEPSGRNLFTCADGSAARVLFERTPERFELLILEQDARQERGDLLAAQALEAKPDCKVLLVTPGPGSTDLPLRHPRRCAAIAKPFGLLELREKLAGLMPVAAAR